MVKYSAAVIFWSERLRSCSKRSIKPEFPRVIRRAWRNRKRVFLCEDKRAENSAPPAVPGLQQCYWEILHKCVRTKWIFRARAKARYREELRRRGISYKPTITVFTSIRKRKSVNARVMSLLLYRPEYILRNQALRNQAIFRFITSFY